MASEKLIETIESVLQDEIVCIGNQIVKTISGKEYFLKSGCDSPKYQCEAKGLKELVLAQSVRVAQVISVGRDYILTEYIRRGTASEGFFMCFGREFARMHRFRSEYFGFHENNFIGNNVQMNLPNEEERTDWAAFYFNKRLLFQYKLAVKNGYATRELQNGFQRLEKNIELILNESI